MSTENTSSQFEDIRAKFGRFRILIVGRANAGKTTILQKICNTTENPEIYDGDGNKIDPSQIEGSMGRGIHNVENELIFRSNDKFVFHDSQGFEAGSKVEFERTKKFIADRANTTYLKKRLDAIWYCIPMDKIDRAIQRSEEIFFGECDPNNVPVVVLFTKFDALQAKAVLKLAPSDRRLPLQEKLSKLPPLMEEIFNSADVWGRLAKMAYPPKSSVRLENIHKGNEGHNILVENTAAVLSDEVLQMLFVSAQETNIGLCVKYAAEWVIVSGMGSMCNTEFSRSRELQICKLACWFPHFQRARGAGLFAFRGGARLARAFLGRSGRSGLDQELLDKHEIDFTTTDVQALKSDNQDNLITWQQYLQAGVETLLILEHSFYLSQRGDSDPVSSAAQKYWMSDIPTKVNIALEDVFMQYGTASEEEKVAMICNVVMQNHMERPVTK